MRNRFRTAALAFPLIGLSVALAQSIPAPQPPAVQPSAPLTFEVASVRPAAPIDMATIIAGLRAGRRPEVFHLEGLRATYTYMSLKDLIALAYKIRPYQITGPDWLATDRFDIAANLPEGATRDDVPAMLKALLADRFKLAAHMETREQPVIGLMIAKGGPKLTESTVKPEAIPDGTPLRPGETKIDSAEGPVRVMKNPDGSTTYNMGVRGSFTLKIDRETGEMHMDANGMTTKGFVVMMNTLGGGSGRQVVDMTGLTGTYQIDVVFSLSDLLAGLRDSGIDLPVRPGTDTSDPTGTATVADALGRLGLKLEKTKAQVDQLVVDHVEKIATEN